MDLRRKDKVLEGAGYQKLPAKWGEIPSLPLLCSLPVAFKDRLAASNYSMIRRNRSNQKSIIFQ
jgi:hypothetical protein